MSKKDLLERLSRAPVDSRAARREDDPGAPRSGAEAVTTRVNRNVVRRRRREEAEEPVAVTRRRAAVVTEEAPPREESKPVEQVATERAPAERPLPPEVVAAREAREEPAAPPQPVEPVAEKPVEPPAPAPAPEAPAAPAPVEPAAERPAAPEEPQAPEPVAEKKPAKRPAAEKPPAPAPEPVAAAPEEPRSLPETPRYAGLGKAVVMPPPGYDPTNPMAYRREQEQQRARQAQQPQAPRGRRRADAGAGPAFGAPAAPSAPAGDDRGARRGRRSRTTAFERPMRATQKRRKAVGGAKAASPAPKAQKRKVRIDNVISVGQLAHELGVKAPLVIRTLMDMGQMATITEMLDIDTAALVAAEFDYEVENVGFQETNFIPQVVDAEEEGNLQSRPPVVTIMGHVDHGKTTLLDAIRNARVAAGEAGGITQHIGAYQVEQADGRAVTFIDTPGHEAFSAMRARGADVTDIVVLVVAADDGVQPQTEEAISHAKAAGVPIVVAINKMDKVGVNPDNIKQRLTEYELIPEDWGGDTMFVPVSALKQTGIDDLIESILLQAEVLDLKANPDRFAEGQVIEAKMERGRGAVATVLVQKGTLKRGDHVVIGSAFGKVRAMVDHRGKQLKTASPSTPVELFGLSELPEVGDAMVVVENEKNARKLAEHRAQAKREAIMAQTRRKTAEDLFAQASAAERETLLIILKADVQGTLEALRTSLDNIQVAGAEVKLLHSAVGDISESDVNLAFSNGATLVGFNVNVDAKAREAASQLGVEPEIYSIIYDLIDRVEREMKGLLAPVYELVRQGSAEVRVLFRISRIGTIAGSYVLDGKIGRNNHAKVLREGSVVWEGKVSGLKRFKDDVREVSAGYECGISLDGYDELREGDVIEVYSQQVVDRG